LFQLKNICGKNAEGRIRPIVDFIEFFRMDGKFDSTERYQTSPSDNSGHGLNQSKCSICPPVAEEFFII
jgi:hypothetical protein